MKTKTDNSLVRINATLLLLAALFLVAWKLPLSGFLQDIVLMSLPTHMFAETFSIVISILIFALVFSSHKEDYRWNPIVLACSFLAIGLLDFAHTISYGGMPAWVTPGSPDKSIYFWLVARYIAALALFVTAIQIWKKSTWALNRYWWLFISLAVTAIAYWIGLYHLDLFPRTFIEGQGLTNFKVGAEYGLIAILLVPAYLFYKQAKSTSSFDVQGLYAATVITILSELCFTLYANVTGLFILLGHIYKVIAYIYLFRAIFLFVVRDPYEKLYQSQEYNRTLFETATIGLAVAKQDGTLLDINQAYADIIGYDIEEVKKLTYWQITPHEYISQEQLQLESLERNKSYGPYEKEYVHKDGHRVPVRLSGRMIEQNDEQFIWSSVEDITLETASEQARNESEQHLRQLAEHIREVFWLKDVKTNAIKYISPAYETIWGKTCESLYANPSTLLEAIHADDIERVKTSINLQTQGPYDEEYRIIRPDGSVRWVRDQSYPIYDNTGTAYRVAGIVEDVTDEKFAQDLLEQRVLDRTQDLHDKEVELISAKEEAERANLAKSQFLSKMSHELRTPLNAILGFSQLLSMDSELNVEQKESVNEIHHGGKHLLELINEVLDLAKIEAGNYEIESGRVDVHTVLNECLSLSTPMLKQYHINASINSDSSVALFANADITRLKQVFLNLISNACKYNHPDGSLNITVNTTETNRIRITFKDTGIGISTENITKIFEPFNRLSAEYSSIEGTGIGLTITKQLIESMGGTIDCNSKLGEGSVFWIEIPVYEAPETSGNYTSQRKIEAPNTTDTPASVKAQHSILYIEDNPANLKLVKKIIKQHPEFIFLSAITPEEGIKLALSIQPDLILLDINLPGMNGYEVMEHLLQHDKTKDIMVIAVTANAMTKEIERGMDIGFRDYITKPINVENFITTIQKHLGQD